jgi:hypothetical protein
MYGTWAVSSRRVTSANTEKMFSGIGQFQRQPASIRRSASARMSSGFQSGCWIFSRVLLTRRANSEEFACQTEFSEDLLAIRDFHRFSIHARESIEMQLWPEAASDPHRSAIELQSVSKRIDIVSNSDVPGKKYSVTPDGIYRL